MKRLVLLFALLTCVFLLSAQPTIVGNSLENGTYTETSLTDMGAFRQAQLQGLSSATGREWNFIPSTGNFSINWRPYTSGQTLSAYNKVIDPGTEAASARYNSGTGGQPGLLPLVQAGSYYTINVTEFGTPQNQYMAILESNWCHTCRPITAVSGTGCLDECGYEVTVTMAQYEIALNEFVYVRYSTDGFTTSSLVPVSFPGPFVPFPFQPAIGTATIPGQGAGVGVEYYVYSTNRTLAQIQAEVTAHGQVAHDMMTINLNNNGGSNYTVAACTNYAAVTAVCQSTVVNLDVTGNAVLLAADVDGGSTDECSSISLAVSPNSFSCADIGASNVVLTVTDGTGNTAACSASVTIADPLTACAPPFANCMDATVSLDPNGLYTLMPSEVDNGSSASGGIVLMTVSPNTFDCASIANNDHTVTLLVEDGRGDQATCTAAVTVRDQVAPSMLCLSSTTVNLDPAGNASISYTNVDNGSTDACGLATLNVSPNNFTCSNFGNNTVTLNATDNNGNASSCTANVNVQDPNANCCALIAPSLTFNSTFSNLTICSGNLPFSSPQGTVARTGSTQAIKVDITAVGVPSASSSYTYTVANRSIEINNLFGNGTVTYVITAYSFGNNGVNEQGGGDDCLGQTATYVVTVNALPTAIVSGGGTVCPGAVAPDVSIALTGTGPWSLTYSNGSGTTTVNPVTASPYIISNPSNGTYTVTNVTDLGVTPNCSNTGTGSAVVLRQDNTPPVAICQDITIDLDASGMASIVASDVDNGSTDACGLASLAVSPNTFDCDDVGLNTVTLTVTDNGSNQTTCTAGVIVDDATPPTALCQDVTVQLNGSGNATLIASDIDNGSSDACGISSLSASRTTFACVDIGNSQNVVLTVTDVNGNTASCSSSVTVENNNPPSASCQNITVNLDNSGNASIVATDINAGSGGLCSGATLSASPTTFDCNHVGANTVTLTVTDNNNNSSSCTASVWVNDNAPTAKCQNITAILGVGSVTVPASMVDNGSSDDCGGVNLSLSPNNFTCSQEGSNRMVTLTVTDNNNNASTCTALVHVDDQTQPVAKCQDITVQLDVTGQVTVSPGDIENGSSDNCGFTNAVRVIPDGDFDCNDIGPNVVGVRVGDGNGNRDTCYATVTVEDNIAPTAICQDITVSLDNSGDASIVASDVDNGSTDACGLASLSLSPSSFDCNDLGSNTVSLRATDMNGNEATCTANVEITWDPVSFSAAPRPVCQNGTVSFTDNSLDAVNWSWDFGDGSAGSTQQNPTHIFPDDDTASYDITLTITTSDGCTLSKTLENYIRVDQPISKFNLNPANGCSIPHTVFFTDQSTLPDTWLWNFGDNNTSTLQNPVHNYTSFGVFPVSLIVVDTINGCTDTAYATVRVEDNDPPTALCQSATLALAANGQGTLLPANVDGGSSDNCGIESMSVSPSTFDCNHLGQNTVTLSVADARNQSAQCTAMVTVTDPLSACCDAPVAICQDITVQLDANGEYSLAASEVDNGSSADCGGLELEVDPDLLDCDDIGVETVTLTASDINEDSDQCTASVTVQDNIPPSFSHLTCGTPSNAAATAYNDGWQSGDNDGSGFGPWSLAPATNNNNEGFFLGEASTNGSSIFNGSANDSNGDNDIDTDGKALGLYANGGFNFEARATRSFLGAFGKGSVLKADFDNGFIDNGSQIEFILRSTTNINSIFVRMVGGGTHYALQDAYGLTIFTSIPYTDEGIHVEVTNLGGDQYEVELTRLVDGVSQSLIASVAPGVMIGGIQIVNGNAGSGITRNLYINNMAICHPTPGCPSNIAVNTDPEVCGAVVSYDDIVAVDNCTNQPTISQIAGQASGTFFAVGTTTNTFTASDANGNTASCSFDVTVTDNEAPTVTCQDLTLGLDATGQASLALSNTELANSVNDFSGVQGSNGWEYGTNSAFNSAGFTRLPNFTGFVWNNPGATLDFPQLDAQGGHPNLDNLFWAVRRWTSNYSGAIRISGDFFDRDVSCGAGANVRIFKNGTEVYQYLNISGTSTPYSLQLTIQPGDQIDFAIDPKFTGGCDDTHFTAVITEQGVAASFDDNCGVASLSASPTVFDCQDIGNHTVTLQVTDNNGNMASCTSNVKVIDDVAPVAKCQDLTVQLDANGQYVLAASEADNGSSDNCQLASVVINGFSSVTLGCGNVNVPATVPLRATDASGNSSICQVTITTLDVTPPTAICQPATVVLSSVDGTGSITVSDVDGGSSDACGIASLTASPSQFDCSMVGNNTVTLMVTDNNGNVASCTTTVFVDDSQSKPATLAQQNCGNCGQIQIFYCRYDAAPAGLNDFIDGAEQTNGNYVSGNTLFWYDDNGGSQGGAHMGTGQEPATPSTATPSTTFYWVAQIDQNTGCFGDAIRVRVRVRNTPDPVLTAPTTPFCEGAQIDLASRVSDNNNNADVYDFYDGDPNAGGILIGSVTATNGTVDAGQNIVVTPVVGNNTYWVVATNTAGNFNIPCPATTSMSFVVTAKPVVTPISDIKACPGDPILVNFSAAPASNPIFIWTNSNTNIGLGVSGFGNPNFTAAANSSGAAEVGNIAVRAISNGCPSDLEQFTITVNSDGVIDPSSSVTVCSGQPTGMTLATAVGGPAAASYELVSVSLDAGLVADGGNQAPGASLGASALAADRYTNHSSASLTATYSLRVITVDNCTSAVQTVTATILPAPVVTANLADTVCSGQPANLTLSTVNSLPATSFSWAPQSLPAGISLINSSSPGSVISDILTNSTASPIDVIFDVTATAGNCASIVVPCTIRVVPFPSVPPTASLSACEDPNNPGQASFNLSSLDQAIGGGLTVNYFTDPNLLNPILQPGAFLSGNTTVYASVVNPTAPCPNRTDISLTVGSLAVPQVSSSTFPCSNTSQAIAPTPVLGISFHFYNNDPDLGGTLLGSGASYDPMLSTGQSQTIWVTATDGNCESDAVSTTVTVLAAPTASISSNLSNGQICEGDTLELFGSGGGTYSWTGPNGFSSTQQNVVIPGFVLADTGEYILTVSNGLCSRPDTIYVVGNRIADPGQNGTLTIAANAAPVNLFNYLLGSPQPGGVWAGPSSPYGGDLGTFNPNFMYSGVYTYTLTNPGACRDSVVFATVTVNVTPVTAAKVRARVFLEGVLDTTSFLMVDSLRKNLFMPTVEPYGQMGYAHVNGGGNESIPVSMLNTTGNNALVDWVYIELRRANDFTHIEATRSALLQRDGDIVELDGVSPVCFNRVSPGFYYVVIGHRNHLSVMTASTVFLNSAGTINLDFTSGVLGVYGTNPQNITATTVITGGVRVMVGGDADFNGQVQNVDDVNFWAIQVGGSGYLESDYDCNGQVQNSDRVNVWNPNVGKGTQVPVRSN